jgi:hypothetical protein
MRTGSECVSNFSGLHVQDHLYQFALKTQVLNPSAAVLVGAPKCSLPITGSVSLKYLLSSC